jgi:hypothetical protein
MFWIIKLRRKKQSELWEQTIRLHADSLEQALARVKLIYPASEAASYKDPSGKDTQIEASSSRNFSAYSGVSH